MRMSMISVAAAAVLAATAGSAAAFDRETVDALKACHDYVWFEVPEFKDMPNAAVSVWPSSEDGGTFVVFWNVSWDEPKVRAAGSCTVVGGKITAFEEIKPSLSLVCPDTCKKIRLQFLPYRQGVHLGFTFTSTRRLHLLADAE